MELPGKYKQLKKEEVKGIYNGDQALALEVVEFFKKKIVFGRVMGLIKKVGRQKVYAAFNAVRQSDDAKNPAGLFLYKCQH